MDLGPGSLLYIYNMRALACSVQLVEQRSGVGRQRHCSLLLIDETELPLVQGRIQSNVVGGVPELLGGCELDGAKRRRASATEAARSACRGSCGRGLGAQK